MRCVDVSAKAVVDVQEVLRVAAGVSQHIVWERPHSPIRQLMLLVERDPAVVLEKMGQRQRGVAQGLGGVVGVEAIHYVESKVPLQPEDVGVTAVEDLHHLRVGKEW